MDNQQLPSPATPPSPPPPPSTALPPTPQPTGKNSLAIWLLLFFIIATVICGTVYLVLFSPRQSTTPSTTTPTPANQTTTPTPQTTQGTIPTPTIALDSWKTYTNTTHGFLLQYPPNYSVEELPEEIIIDSKTIEVGPDGYSSGLHISITEGDLVANNIAEKKNDLLDPVETAITIDQIPGKQLSGFGDGQLAEKYIIDTEVSNNTKTVSFFLITTKGATFNPSVYNQILTTFTFGNE